MTIKLFFERKIGALAGCVNNWKYCSCLLQMVSREILEHELKNIELSELIKEYDERFSDILRYRRMTSWINHFNHTHYGIKRIYRIM